MTVLKYIARNLAPAMVDPDAIAFISATGITDAPTKTAIDNFVIGLKAQSLWAKINAIYPMVGGTSSTCKFNLKNPLDTDAAFRLTFTGTSAFTAAGFQPNGSSGYANTHYTPNIHVTLNSETMGIYSTTNNTPLTNDSIDIGTYISASTCSYLGLRAASGKNQLFTRLNSTAHSLANTDARGFFVTAKNGNTTNTLYKNGSAVSSTTSAGNLSSIKTYIGTLNLSGTAYAGGYTNQNYALVFLGAGMSDTDVANMYTLVQAFMTARGINV